MGSRPTSRSIQPPQFVQLISAHTLNSSFQLRGIAEARPVHGAAGAPDKHTFMDHVEGEGERLVCNASAAPRHRDPIDSRAEIMFLVNGLQIFYKHRGSQRSLLLRNS